MLKKMLQAAINARYQFMKYAVVGTSGFVIDMGSLILLKEVFGIRPVVAVVMNQAVLLVYNFTLNKYWSFQNREMAHWQAVRYGMLAAWNYFFAAAAMYLFNDQWGFDYRLVRLLSVVGMVSWNFVLYRQWVYRSSEPGVRCQE